MSQWDKDYLGLCKKILTEGKVDIDKLQPITFDPAHQTYRQIGAVVGRAFQDGNLLK